MASIFGRVLKQLGLNLFLPGIGGAIGAYDEEINPRRDDNDKWFTKIVKGFNNMFNRDHDWFDYNKWNDSWDALSAKTTGSALTPAEQAANEFSASEAQKQRDFEMEMSNSAYQRQVADMRAAGVNPAMAMNGGSGASTPSGSAATSVSPQSGMSFQDILSFVMLPLQRKLLKAQALNQLDQGQAALINANANAAGVPIKKGELGVRQGELDVRRGELGVKEYEAETNRIRTDIERFVADTNARLTDKQIDKMSHEIAYIDETKAYISKNYYVAVKNADAHQKQAIASLRSAEAAFQNALTNEYLSNYQSDVLFSTCLVNDLVAKEKSIDISFLPEKTQAQINELRSRGYLFDQQGRLIDKQGKLVEAQTAETYTRIATEITHSLCEVVNTATGLIPGKQPARIGFK